MSKRKYLGIFESDLIDLSYNDKRALETVGEHNLLHSLSWSMNDSDYECCKEDKTKPSSGLISTSDPSVNNVASEIIRRHKSCHEFLLEYPELSDNFDSGRLDDTLAPEFKMAYLMCKAQARRAQKDKEDGKTEGNNVLVKMIKVAADSEED